ncbi:MAG: 16S rRNA (uracil(1498)-N(3))-methyltransferase [Pyrinomonadaceae bacterium]
MTRRRFFASPKTISLNEATVQLDQAETRHLRDVLRQRAGDEAYVFDGQGGEYRCLVLEATAKTGVLTLIEPVEPASCESSLRLTLAVALLKGEKFDLVVQKATELGVTRIVPVLTERSDVRLTNPGAAAKRVDRWNRLALEAAKQSGRAFVPACDEPMEFSSLVTGTSKDVARFMFTERNGIGFSHSGSSPVDAIALVGPEGGWADEELDLSRAHGWRLITLGGRILRAETAAITVTALMQHRFGDLR